MARKGLPKSIIKKYGITKKAWRVFRGRKSKSKPRKAKTTRKTTRKSNPKGGNKRMGKGKSLVQSAVQLSKVGAVILPAAIAATSPGTISHKARLYLTFMSGIEIDSGGNAKFRPERLLTGWGPLVGVTVGSKIASKIGGLIRRI